MSVRPTQYGRAARLSLVSLGPPLVINPVLPVPGGASPAQIEITYRVSKSTAREPNRSVITCRNLSQKRLDLALGNVRRTVNFTGTGPIDQRFGVLGEPILDTTASGFAWLTLEAGYGAVPQILFEGQCDHVQTVRRGKDRITTFHVGDAVLPLNQAVANLSYGPGTPVLTVVKYLAGVCGLTVAPSPALALLGAETSIGGIYASGKARDILEEVINPFEFEWWVEDSTLWVLPKAAVIPAPPVIVSGYPVPGAVQLLGQPEPVDNDGLQIRTLLAPQIRPGHTVAIQASQGAGTYRVEHVDHLGGNRGGRNESIAVIRDPSTLLPF